MKILLYTDLSIRPDQLFWHRDLGLLTQAFRELGHDAWLVVHPAHPITGPTPSDAKSEPVLWASPKEVRQSLWWKTQKPDMVILGLWTRPRYDPIRRAALSATPRVIERADSDGMRTASCGLKTYFQRRYDYFRDRTYPWPAPLSIFLSLLYALVSILATPWIERRLAKTLSLLPKLTVETPGALCLWQDLAARLQRDPSHIFHVPHPVQTHIFRHDPTVPKENQVLSVGRWNSYQKNFPFLRKVLHKFLQSSPEWKAAVVGPVALGPSSTAPVRYLGEYRPEDLARVMQSSRIFLSSSRYESFGLAAAEALCCGCIPVGPSGLLSFKYFQSFFSEGRQKWGLSALSFWARQLPSPDQVARVAARADQAFDPRQIAQSLLSIADGREPTP